MTTKKIACVTPSSPQFLTTPRTTAAVHREQGLRLHHNAVLVSSIPDRPATCLSLRSQRAIYHQEQGSKPITRAEKMQPKPAKNNTRRTTSNGGAADPSCPVPVWCPVTRGPARSGSSAASAASPLPALPPAAHAILAVRQKGLGPAAEDGDGPYFGLGWHLMVGVGDRYVSGLCTWYNSRPQGSSTPVSRFLAVLFSPAS